MDLHAVTVYDVAHERADLVLGAGEAFLGGGTWLFSEPQPHLHRVLDLTGLDWQPVSLTPDTLEVAATCTVERLAGLSGNHEWPAAPVFRHCAEALLASWKIWKQATVGGNICLSLPAGSMISLAVAFEATAVIWTVDGGERQLPINEFVTGIGSNTLTPGEVLRAIRIPMRVLHAHTAFRKISLSPLGRSGAVVIGRHDLDGTAVLSVTAATTRPYVLRFPQLPTAQQLSDALTGFVPVESYHTDAHGPADWRRAVTAVLAEEVRTELSSWEDTL